MKNLFEPVYSVDTWKEVIVDSEKSIELLKQGYNPMGVNVGDWIIKYRAMRSIALQKLYELEQGLRVAANTLKNEDSNEELNGVRVPAGSVSEDVITINHSHVELPVHHKSENAGEEVVEVVAKVAKVKLDEEAIKANEEKSRALVSHEEKIDDAGTVSNTYGLKQGLQVAANTLEGEDRNEKLIGVRVLAGNVSGVLCFASQDRYGQPSCCIRLRCYGQSSPRGKSLYPQHRQADQESRLQRPPHPEVHPQGRPLRSSRPPLRQDEDHGCQRH